MSGGSLGGGGLLDPDGALDRMSAWKGRIDQLAANTAAMRERLHGIQETVADANRIVEVTVDSTGDLVDLRLTHRIQRIAPDVVSRAILTTIGEAKARVAARTAEIIGETMGSDLAVGKAIAERIGEQLLGPVTGGPVGSDMRAQGTGESNERGVDGRGRAF